jgi:hypothetical protein
MSIGAASGPIHPVQTRRSRHRYLFYDKHHGRGDPGAARWLPGLSQEDEFAVFDVADWEEVSDEGGWLYGLRARDGAGHIPDLGTWSQQIAAFPFARPNVPWHGYPLWPLGEGGPKNRKGEKDRPSKQVFLRMEAVAMITRRERKKLYKGDHL